MSQCISLFRSTSSYSWDYDELIICCLLYYNIGALLGLNTFVDFMIKDIFDTFQFEYRLLKQLPLVNL